ncbi:glycoside hydrolase family 3 protein [bacterium]|nr:glycoside hydrolase family 3 protein [bacterium]
MSAADLARRLVVGLGGPVPSAEERAWLALHRPAGVILFSRNCIEYSQLSKLCQDLHELCPGLEIMADHEGGPVSQLAAAVGRPPAAWTLGVLDDAALTADVHAETARRLAAVGVDRVLAPVADVLVAPRNPVIGSRAFGDDPGRVARQVVAAVTGLVDGGVRVCLKHWPGHGGSEADTHETTAAAGAGALAAPFEAGLNAGADAVMVGHVGVGETGLPATLDGGHLAEARARLGAGGARPLLFADDVTMGALRPALAAQGVVVPGAPRGLLEPTVLPLTWFEALADAGCDRFLVRGLPLAAWPVAGETAPPATRRVAPSGRSAALPEAPAWARVRERAWRTSGAGFGDRGADLLWWDATVGDRWQVAGGDRGTTRELLGDLLTARFRRVRMWGDATAPAGAATRLLVCSHRPLDPSGRPDPGLAREGVALALGHPSLPASLRSYLPAGWRVGHLADIAPEDLFRDP